MSKLNWKEEGLKWFDGSERAELLESRRSDELSFDEVKELYEQDFALKDDECVWLNLNDIKRYIK